MGDIQKEGITPPETEGNALVVATDKSDGTYSGLLNAISALRNIMRAAHNFHSEIPEITAIGYGPNDWRIAFDSSYTPCYNTMTIGDEKRVYMLRNQRVNSNFSNFDEFILTRMASLESLVPELLTLFREPPPVFMDGITGIDPADLGFPFAGMCEGNTDYEIISRAISPYCRPTREKNPHYSTVSVLSGFNLSNAQRQVIHIARDEMKHMRRTINIFIDYTTDGAGDDALPPPVTQNMLFDISACPYHLNLMFDKLPRGLALCHALTVGALNVDAELEVISPGTMCTLASVSATRATAASDLINVSFSPSMVDAINAWILSLLSPGLVAFDLDFGDLDHDAVHIRAIAGLAAKLLLSYHVSERWCNITEQGIHVAESAIVSAGSRSRILEYIGGGDCNFPMDNYKPIKPGPLRYAELCTRNDGNGWMNGPFCRMAMHPEENIYPACTLRQKHVHDFDDLRSSRADRLESESNLWQTGSAVVGYVRALANGTDTAGAYSGMSMLMITCVTRIFQGFAVVNDFNRKNWYTGFRPTEALMEDPFHDGSGEKVIVTMSGKTLLYLLKSFSFKLKLVRKNDIYQQLKAECAITRDCVDTLIRQEMFDRILSRYQIPRELYRSSEVIQLIAPKSGPIRQHIDLCLKSALSSRILDYYSFVSNLPMVDPLRTLITVVIENPAVFGASEHTLMYARLRKIRLEGLKELAKRSLPYMNVADPEDIDPDGLLEPTLDVGVAQLSNLITKYSTHTTLSESARDRIIRLNFPLPLRMEKSMVVVEGNIPVEVDYAKTKLHHNFRENVTFHPTTLQVVDINESDLRKPDLYLKNFSNLELMYIPRETACALMMPLEGWLCNISQYVDRRTMVRTDLVRVTNIFERTK